MAFDPQIKIGNLCSDHRGRLFIASHQWKNRDNDKLEWAGYSFCGAGLIEALDAQKIAESANDYVLQVIEETKEQCG